jgi:hypothetical protein
MWQRRAVQFHTSHQLERPIQEDAMGFFWGPRLKCTSARPICCRRPRAAKALVVARALPSYTQKLLCWMPISTCAREATAGRNGPPCTLIK